MVDFLIASWCFLAIYVLFVLERNYLAIYDFFVI